MNRQSEPRTGNHQRHTRTRNGSLPTQANHTVFKVLYYVHTEAFTWALMLCCWPELIGCMEDGITTSMGQE